MSEENWFALNVTVISQASEAIEFALNELDSKGTEINNLGKSVGEDVIVVGYFNEKPTDENLESNLIEALRIYGFSAEAIKKTSWQKVENQDWLHEWKKHWKPTEIGRFIIAPPWEIVDNSDKILIRIEPNMAFGTGTHETTKLCLKAIEEHYSPEMSFFDVGTGTGILSIAVGKIQSSKLKVQNPILACDTDEDSVNIAIENAESNGITSIKFCVGSISEDTPEFDFVCANVTVDIIIPMLPMLIEKAKKLLVLSGILVEQEKETSDELTKLGCTNFEVQTDGEWISFLIRV